MMNERDRVELVRLDPERLQQDLDSPTVRGLVARGFTCGPMIALQLVREGPPVPHLVLFPPVRPEWAASLVPPPPPPPMPRWPVWVALGLLSIIAATSTTIAALVAIGGP